MVSDFFRFSTSLTRTLRGRIRRTGLRGFVPLGLQSSTPKITKYNITQAPLFIYKLINKCLFYLFLPCFLCKPVCKLVSKIYCEKMLLKVLKHTLTGGLWEDHSLLLHYLWFIGREIYFVGICIVESYPQHNSKFLSEEIHKSSIFSIKCAFIERKFRIFTESFMVRQMKRLL